MKYFIITKKQIITAVSITVTAIILLVSSFKIFAASEKKLPIYCVECNEKKIAVSFDAAWGNDDTETLIDILAQYDVPATFFVVGAWVDKYPDSVKQLSNAGHQVQNHSNTHPYMTKLSLNQMCEEINACNEKIKAITGKTPSLFRPPYGDYDSAVVKATESLNMNAVQWNVDSLDWKENATAKSISERVINKVCPGSIILMHNDAEHTPEALPIILDTLKKDGYEFVFISDLIMKDNYTIDHSGKQCKCEN